MREGKRVFGVNCNPITALVNRDADHKNSRGYTRTQPDVYRACPFGGRG